MVRLLRGEAAALAVLDELETLSPYLADIWAHGSVEVVPGDQLIDTRLGVVPCISSGMHGLAPIGEPVSDLQLRAIALLLTHAHTLIALARIALERTGSWNDDHDRAVWPPDHCRHCRSKRVEVFNALGDDVFEVSCLDCGASLTEICPGLAAPPAALPAPGPSVG